MTVVISGRPALGGGPPVREHSLSSRHRQAAVDGEALARDGVGRVRGKVDAGLGEIRNRRRLAQRGRLGDVAEDLVGRQRRRVRALQQPAGDEVRADADGPELKARSKSGNQATLTSVTEEVRVRVIG